MRLSAGWILPLLIAVAALAAIGIRPDVAAAAPCDPPIQNEIVCENSKPGNPASEWDVSGAGDPAIQGFATDISVDQGQTVHFKVNTSSAAPETTTCSADPATTT